MTETFTSKFTNGIWGTVIITCIFTFGVAIFCIVEAVQSVSTKDWGLVAMFCLFAVIMGYVGFNNANTTLLQVSAAPEGLILNYLLTRKQIIVDYADIKHESINQERSKRDPSIVNGTLKIVLELSTGETINLLEDNYENFKELAEAIRRARFKLE